MHAFGVLHSVRKVKYLEHEIGSDWSSKRVEVDVLIADLLNVEETAQRSDIGLSEVFNPVHDGGTNRPSDTVVVRFADPTDRRNVGFEQEVLCIVCTHNSSQYDIPSQNAALRTRDTLLRNDEIWLKLQQLVDHRLHLLLLDLLYPRPICLLRDFDVGLRLALLVLERAIQQDNSGVRNPPPHFGMCDVLVDHDSVQYAALLDLASRDLLHARVTLDVDGLNPAVIARDGPDCLERKLAHEVGPSHDKLGANRGLDERQHFIIVLGVYWNGDALDDLESLLQRLVVRRDDDDRMNITLKL